MTTRAATSKPIIRVMLRETTLPHARPLMSPLDRLVMLGARFAMARTLRLDERVELLPLPAPEQPIGLYLHVPFCESLCPFCPFHRQHYRATVAAGYLDALEQEIEAFERHGYRFHSIYVGGGTPTVEAHRLSSLLLALGTRHRIDTIAVETNPNHLDAAHLDPLVDAGVNRLSVGVQSLDDTVLERIGRLAAYGSGARTLERLVPVFERFDTVNVDMMFNLPEQSDASIEADLDALLELDPPQISYYPLMPPLQQGVPVRPVQGAEPLHRRTLHPRAFDDVAFDRERGLYERICARLDDAFLRSSVWCFNARSRHSNAAIDEYIVEDTDYLGLGSGSFSLLGRRLLAGSFSVDDYVRRVREFGHGMSTGQTFSAFERRCYLFLTRLFAQRWPNDALRADLGNHWRLALTPLLQAMTLLGAFERDPDGLALSARGRYFWLMLMREFFMRVNVQRARLRTLDERRANPLALVPTPE